MGREELKEFWRERKMKFSLKIQDSNTRPLLFRAKIPITIFNLPFLSGFSTTTHQPSSDFSPFLATNFSSGPTLKLAYTATSFSSSTSATPPLTLTLKSGFGLYGSPKNSPFIISANCSVYPHSPHSTPTFSLILKPQAQLGSFFLKAGSSNPASPEQNVEADSIFRGISVMAKTEIPVSKRVLMSCRWGLNFPEDLGKRIPHLTLNKIVIKKVDEVKEKKKKSVCEVESLKGMCFSMKRELDTVQRKNREIKLKLEETKTGSSQGPGKKMVVGPIVESSSSSQDEGKKKNPSGGDIGRKEVKKNGNRAGVESELQNAIKAAASSSPLATV